MAANITQFGRVEFDPMRVPQLARGTDGTDTGKSFENELAEVSRSFDADDRTGELADRERRDEPSVESNDTRSRDDVPARDESPEPTDAPSTPADETTASDTTGPNDSPTVTQAGTDANQIREGEAPVRGTTAGKGAGASSSSFTQSGPTVNPAVSLGTTRTNPAIAAAGAAPAQAATASPSTHQAVPAIRESAATAGKTAATEAPVGYRTLHLPTLQAAEASRDSVFRQIALHLMPDGGEMHVLLDPPQLGELEMKLVVDGDKLRLAVVAERPEVAAMMQKHMAELRQHLQTQGLTVTDADVRARDPHEQAERDANPRGSRHFHQDRSEDDAAAITPRMNRNFITAEGLDFWI
ncbi:MAG: flagellar hook-length control protein FliK [Planctomycetes bacterium]|nr:flagellar hook-length control protein FliK [Planctomycetota bacterium]